MKKLFSVLLILAALCMVVIALGETQESWNEGCDWRLSEDAEVRTFPTDAQPVLTLPRGTWIRLVSEDGTWSIIDYFAGGQVRSGAVLSRFVVRADGTVTPAPTAAPTPLPLATAIPSIVTPEPAPVPDTNGMLTPMQGPAAPVVTAAPAVSLLVTIAGDQPRIASVITLGSCTSLVMCDGEQIQVPTADIICTPQQPAGRQVAAITAPKGGVASMRRDASLKSAVVTKLKDGQLVCVLAEEQDFTLVQIGAYRGYVATGVLNFDVLVAEPYGTGVLCSSNGKTTGKGTVNVRVTMKKTATKSNDWPIGATVTLLVKDGDWYLAELDGCRGYVYRTFVKEQK